MKYLDELQDGKSILNEREIISRLSKGDLVITPIINYRRQIGPTSIDLRLGTEFRIFKVSMFTHLEPKEKKEIVKNKVIKYTEKVKLQMMNPFILHPDEFVLASTLEYMKLPLDLAGRLEGRSSWGRIGLQIHSTAGFVDPGFEGILTFELQNVGRVPILLYAGLRIAQICFYNCKTTAIPYTKKIESKYAYKLEPLGSLFYEDEEFKKINKYFKKRNYL